MPDLNEMLVARLVREDWPDLPNIFATGSIEPAEVDLPPQSDFLQKPFTIDALIAMIQRSRKSDL